MTVSPSSPCVKRNLSISDGLFAHIRSGAKFGVRVLRGEAGSAFGKGLSFDSGRGFRGIRSSLLLLLLLFAAFVPFGGGRGFIPL